MIYIDNNIFIKDEPCTAGAGILEGFKPLFDAQVVTRLKAQGKTLKLNALASEFGLSAHHAHDACPRLCVDVTGGIRKAALAAGKTFIKPSYGTVSRYGIIPVACSGEQVGVLADDLATAKEILTIIAGHDPKDSTSLPEKSYHYDDQGDPKILQLTEENFPELKLAAPAWRILMSAEACNNFSRYDGVKYGRRAKAYTDIDSLYNNSRTEGFSFETKQVILYGSDVLSKERYQDCYDKALRIRRRLQEKLSVLFTDYDVLISEDAALPLITGIPALVHGGVQYLADLLCDGKLFAAAGKGGN